MGAAASLEAGEEAKQVTGFRVLSVEAGSPAANVLVFPDAAAARAGIRTVVPGTLVAWFDIIVSINGIELVEDSDAFADEMARCHGMDVILEVWNIKTQALRTVQAKLRPAGSGALLGVSVKFEPVCGTDACCHVVAVEPGSIAAAAGLVAEDDYLLGEGSGVPLDSVEAFGEFLYEQSRAGTGTASMYVYRESDDTVRLVTVPLPAGEGEGESRLGLEVAAGHMHLLPRRDRLGRNAFQALSPAAASNEAPTVATMPFASFVQGAAVPAAPPEVAVSADSSSSTPQSASSSQKTVPAPTPAVTAALHASAGPALSGALAPQPALLARPVPLGNVAAVATSRAAS